MPIISHTDDYSVNPIAQDLQRIRIKNLRDVPNAKRSGARDRPFITALSSLLAKLDPQYLVEESGDQISERLGLISFLEELSCHHPGRFDGFHKSTTNQCLELGHALKLLACSLKQSVRWKELGHKLWCPIACLKHHNLILCVLEKSEAPRPPIITHTSPISKGLSASSIPPGIGSTLTGQRLCTSIVQKRHHRNITHKQTDDSWKRICGVTQTLLSATSPTFSSVLWRVFISHVSNLLSE